MGDNVSDNVGIFDTVATGFLVGVIELAGAVVGVIAIANDGALVGTSVAGLVVLKMVGARDGVIVMLFVVGLLVLPMIGARDGAMLILLAVVVVGMDGKMSPSAHPSVKSCKYGLIVPF